MKRYALYALIVFVTFSLQAREKISKPIKKAGKATCSVMTYNAEGTLLHTSQGFFVGEGELITSYDSFLGAVSAVTTDAAGITRPVQKVTGANELYGTLRASVPTDKKLFTLSIDSIAATEGDKFWLLPVSSAKKEAATRLTIVKVERVADNYNYYTLSGPALLANPAGRPLLNDEGKVVAVMQTAAEGDSIFYALDVRFGMQLEIKGLTLNETSYRKLEFPKALPKDIDQAQVWLFLAEGQQDKEMFARTVEAFIEQFPQSPEGYLRRAAISIADKNCEQAEADFSRALETAEKKDDALYQIARQKATAIKADSTLTCEGWSLNGAAEDVRRAIDMDPQPAYYQLLGDICFTAGNYPAACEAYTAICDRPEATAENFYNAAIACEQIPDSSAAAIALMTRAVLAASDTDNEENLRYDSAPFVYERALMHARHGSNRAAVFDLNLYERLAGTPTDARFYYIREQVEAAARMFQQALDDIDTAISIEALPIYLLEKASLNIRVNRTDEAIPILEKLVADFPDDTDCNRLLGFCHAIKGDIAKARPLLEHAAVLGDTSAEGLIEKYCK